MSYLVFIPARLSLFRQLTCSMLLAVSILCWACPAHAQNLSNLKLGEVYAKLADQGNLIDKIPYLEEIVHRTASSTSDDKAQILEKAYSALSTGYINRYVTTQNPEDLKKSIQHSTSYIEQFPESSSLYIILLNRADAQLSLEINEQVIADYQALLASPHVAKLKDDQKRQCLYRLCLALVHLNQWKEGIPWFNRLFDRAAIPDRRMLAVSALLRAYNELNRPEDAVSLVGALGGRTDERYNVHLNFSLFQLGDKLADNAEFNKANLLYYLTYTVEEIVEYYERKIQVLRRQLKSIGGAADVEEVGREIKREIADWESLLAELKSQQSYTAALKWHKARNLNDMGRRFDSFFAYRRLIEEHPEHENIESFQYTSFVQGVRIQYFDEALVIGKDYLANEENQNYREQVMAKMARIYHERQNYPEVLTICSEFIDRYPSSLHGHEVIFYLANALVRMEAFDELIAKFSGYIEQHPKSPMLEGCYYWLGMSHIFKQEFEPALQSFETLLQKYQRSHYRVAADFRATVCLFGLERYEQSRPRMEAWVAANPNHQLRAEGEVILGDIAAIEARVDEALTHYATIEAHTKNIGLISRGYFESSKLLEANQRHNEAIQHLETFIDRYDSDAELTQAILKVGQLYESLGRPEIALERFYTAIERYGNGRMLNGVDEIVKLIPEIYRKHVTQYEKNLAFIHALTMDADFRTSMVGNRQALYRYSIENKGLDEQLVNQLMRDNLFRKALHPVLQLEQALRDKVGEVVDGEMVVMPEVDLSVLEPYRMTYQKKMERFPETPPEARMQALYASAVDDEKWTLAYRLQMALDKQGVEVAPEKRFYAGDFKLASAATLVWIGQRLEDIDSFEAEKAYDQVIAEFPESVYVADAIYRKAELEFKRARFDLSVRYFQQVVTAFPTNPLAQIASVRWGDAYLAEGAIDNAIERYQEVLKVRKWRGETWARTTYQLGLCFVEKGEPLKAHGFFERTYLSYYQYPKWAGKAYYQSGRVLESLGEIESARNTYRAFLEDSKMQTLAIAHQVKNRYERIR